MHIHPPFSVIASDPFAFVILSEAKNLAQGKLRERGNLAELRLLRRFTPRNDNCQATSIVYYSPVAWGDPDATLQTRLRREPYSILDSTKRKFYWTIRSDENELKVSIV